MNSAELLEAAKQAESFIDSLRVETDGRVLWRQSDDENAPADISLYHGSAGIALFEVELARATGDDAYRRRALAAGHTLTDRIREKRWASVAFATGWPGFAFALQTLADGTGTDEFLDTAVLCIDRMIAQSQPLGRGIGWIEPMPFSDITGKTGDREIYDLSVGGAGAGVLLLHAHRGGLHPRALEWAVAVADRLLEVVEHTPDGSRWGLMSDMPFPFTAPNFAHGGAGVGYFFAQLYDVCGDRRYLDAATSAATYVLSRASAIGVHGGRLVCHTEEQQPPIFYLGECHGPAGTWRLLATLARVEPNTEWLAHARALLHGVQAIGAPRERSAGWWNNHSQCCGDAGLGDSALAMWHATGDTAYLELAQQCAVLVVEQSTLLDGRRSWVQAEHRARPRFVQAQTGYMQGAAGIASFLLHLATSGADANTPASPRARVWFPDERL